MNAAVFTGGHPFVACFKNGLRRLAWFQIVAIRFITVNQFYPFNKMLFFHIWPRNAGLSDFPISWPEAFDFVKQMNATGQYGLNQWRLPSRSELFSLVSHDRINPAIVQPDQFFNLFNGYYWTATPCARYPDQAWYVHLGGGRVVKGMIHRSYMFWPVHDSSPQNNAPHKNSVLLQSRFVLSEDIIVDHAKGLSWLQHADIQ